MNIEVCDTLQKRTRGLQYRDSIRDDCIMIFPNISDGQWFHMNNVPFPITVASLDDEGRVIDYNRLDPQVGLYRTPQGTRTVIETSDTFFDKYSVYTGDYFFRKISEIIP